MVGHTLSKVRYLKVNLTCVFLSLLPRNGARAAGKRQDHSSLPPLRITSYIIPSLIETSEVPIIHHSK